MEFDFHKKKTYTQHWNNFRTKPRRRSSFSVFFKKFKNSIYNFLGFKLSVRLIKNKSQKNTKQSNDLDSNPIDSLIKKELQKWIEKNAEKIAKEIINEQAKKIFK